MGWTTMQKPQNVKEFMDDLYTGENYKVLKSAIVNFREYYAAVQWADGSVSAGVAMMEFSPSEYYDFGYKDMDESVGPNISNCPKSILDLLTETDQPYAISWRNQCRKNAESKAKNRDTFKNLKNGDKITCFGKEYRVHVMQRWTRGKLTSVPRFKNGGTLYRIPKTWKIEIVESA